MKYSFIIPTYNNKVLLKNTLESYNYLSGKSQDYQVVVVDDGSSDGTYEYIKGINRKYDLKYLYLERCADSCRARTRNYGWRNAQGEIIVFIDSDIIIKRDYLTELDRCFSLSRDIMVIGNRLMLNEEVLFADISSGEIFNKYRFDSTNYDLLEFRHFLYETTSYNSNAIICPWMQVYSCNLAIPKQWLESVGGFDENFKFWGLEDLELGYRLYEKKLQLIIDYRLEALHQYHGPRLDLVIQPDKVAGYEINIEYFLNKHPQALRMPRKYAYKFFKGELSSDKMLMDIGLKKNLLEFREKSDLQRFKENLLEQLSKEKIQTIVVDYVEDTDLDLWVQLLGVSTINIVRYYPASRRIDVKGMMKYLKAEKERQKKLA
jgi:glycosyltransferase involved in cell wall biosynthesis